MRNARVIEDIYSRELAMTMRDMGIDVPDLPFLPLIRRLRQYAAIKRAPHPAFPFYEHRNMLQVWQDQEKL